MGNKHEIVCYAHNKVPAPTQTGVAESKAMCSCGETFFQSEQLFQHIDKMNKEEEDVKREMQEVMERPIAELGGHKFPAKYGVGVNWKDME